MSKPLPAAWFAPPPHRAPIAQAEQPEVINRRIQTTFTASPRTDRHVTVQTFFRHGHPVYVVGVVNGFNAYQDPTPREFTDPSEARTAANRLLNRERKATQ